MKLIWTKVPMIADQDVITWGLEEPTSHFAVGFSSGMILHSTFTKGVHLQREEDFLKNRKVVFEIEVPVPIEVERKSLYNILPRLHQSNPYDYKYVIFLAFEAVKKKLFRSRIAPNVTFSSKNGTICHEILGWAGVLPEDFDDSGANTPYRLYLKIKDNLHYIMEKCWEMR